MSPPLLTLVEPYRMSSLPDRPFLGCAMLMAVCKNRGIDIRLVRGQSRWMKSLLLRYPGELWHLIGDLGPDDIGELGIGEFRDHMLRLGISAFKRKLENWYQIFIVEKAPRAYFNALELIELADSTNIAMDVYAHYIREKKHADLQFVNDYVDEIVKDSPRYIGMSLATRPDTVTRAIIAGIRTRSDRPIIFGGAITPYLTASEKRALLNADSGDYLVEGLAEHSLPDLLHALETHGNTETIGGIHGFKRGRLFGTRPDPPIPLDALPFPDYSQYDLDAFFVPERILPIQTTRGCTWKKCAFCAHHLIYGKKHEHAPLDHVEDTLRHLRDRYDCTHFQINDEEITAGRARRLSARLIARGPGDIHLYGYARMVKGFNDDEQLRLMRRAGFRTIAWGLESGNQRVLDAMGKGTRLSDMSGILKKSSRHHMANLCFVLFGFPGEREAEAQQTAEFLTGHAASIDLVMPSFFKVALGSPVHHNPGKWGIDQTRDHPFEGYGPNGVYRRRAQGFVKRLKLTINIGGMRVTRYPLWAECASAGMLAFLRSAHGALPDDVACSALSEHPFDTLYPLILGVIRPNNPNRLQMIDKGRPSVVLAYKKEFLTMDLNRWQRHLFDRADGSRSLGQIIQTLAAHENTAGGAARLKAVGFLTELIQRGSAVVFTLPWKMKQKKNLLNMPTDPHEPAKKYG